MSNKSKTLTKGQIWWRSLTPQQQEAKRQVWMGKRANKTYTVNYIPGTWKVGEHFQELVNAGLCRDENIIPWEGD